VYRQRGEHAGQRAEAAKNEAARAYKQCARVQLRSRAAQPLAARTSEAHLQAAAFNASANASTVSSMSFLVCTSDMKAHSNCDGGQYMPFSISFFQTLVKTAGSDVCAEAKSTTFDLVKNRQTMPVMETTWKDGELFFSSSFKPSTSLP